jgi:hypothetical protein
MAVAAILGDAEMSERRAGVVKAENDREINAARQFGNGESCCRRKTCLHDHVGLWKQRRARTTACIWPGDKSLQASTPTMVVSVCAVN